MALCKCGLPVEPCNQWLNRPNQSGRSSAEFGWKNMCKSN
jgi:hypothetical protein